MSAETPESKSAGRSGSKGKIRKTPVVLTDEQAVELLADGFVAGADTACKRWNVSRKTYDRLSSKVRRSPTLAVELAAKKEEREREYKREILRAALKGLGRLEQLFETETDMRSVAGAVHLLLDKLITREMLGGQQQPVRPTRKDQAAPAPAAGAPAAPASDSPPVH